MCLRRVGLVGGGKDFGDFVQAGDVWWKVCTGGKGERPRLGGLRGQLELAVIFVYCIPVGAYVNLHYGVKKISFVGLGWGSGLRKKAKQEYAHTMNSTR